MRSYKILKTYCFIFSFFLLSVLFTSAASSMGEIPPENPPSSASPEMAAPVSAEAAAVPSKEAVASAEAVKPVSAEAVASIEAVKPASAEAVSSIEAVKPVSLEVIAAPSGEAVRPATPEVIASPEAPTEEGASYKGVPWGVDFSHFKQIKGFAGSLGSSSAAFVNSSYDNDIALLLDVPISGKEEKGGQRIMFEYVPQKFSSVYFEPDDINYIFYDGKFCMAFSKLMGSNFDLYRDNFYKKYQKTGSITKFYEPASKRKYRIDAIIFEKGKTKAFLIKSQATEKDKTTASVKMFLVFDELFNNIRKEIKDKVASKKQSKGVNLEKDLNKIE